MDWKLELVLLPVTDDTSSDSFNPISRLLNTRGVMSMFTPTSMYWNCVFTRPFAPARPAPPKPLPNDPVAIGTRSPIFSDAFWFSDARICGFWISFVFASV